MGDVTEKDATVAAQEPLERAGQHYVGVGLGRCLSYTSEKKKAQCSLEKL